MASYSSYLERTSGGGYGGIGSYRRDLNNGSNYRNNGVAGRTTAPEPPRRQESSLRFSNNANDARRQETPSLRYGSTARFGSQIARSPLSDKGGTVFGVGGGKAETMVIVSRGTSPTAPAESAYMRQRRAARDVVETKEIPTPCFRPHAVSASVQTESDKPTPVQQPSTGIRYTPRPLGISRPTDLAIKPEPMLRSFGRSSLESKSSDIRPYTRSIDSRSPSSELRSPTSPSTASVRPLSFSRSKPESPDPPRNKINTLPPHFPKTDANKNFLVNKDFRKSTLNMDYLNANDNVKNETTDMKKSPSKTSLGLNLKVTQSKTMANVLSKKIDSSSSSESSSSESDSSSEESSEDEKPVKQETNAKPVVVRAVEPLATPQKVKPWTKEEQNQQTHQSNQSSYEPTKGFSLRKFDSTDAPWWAESKKDVPSLAKNMSKMNISKKSTKDVPGSLKATSSSEESSGLPRPPSKSKIPGSKTVKDIAGIAKNQESTSVTSSGEDSSPKLKKIPSKTKLDVKSTKDVPGLVKTPSFKSVQSSSEDSSSSPGLKKTSSKTLLSAKSTKDVPGLAKVPSMKSIPDGRSVGKEFTPGLNRLHARFEEERKAYKLRRVDSEADQDWWLDDSEKETEEEKRRKKYWAEDQIYLGPLQDIDLIFRTKAPPPCAFKYSDDEESSDEAANDANKNKVSR